MSDVAVSNSYASQAAYNTQVQDARNSQAATKLDSSAVQGSVDQAIVDALLSMLSAMAHNQKMPKNVLNQLIDFLQNYLTGGGTKPDQGAQPIDGPGTVGAPCDSSNVKTVHMEPGDELKIDGKSVVAHGANELITLQHDPNTIHVWPGQTVEVGGTKFTNDAKPDTSPIYNFPPPSGPNPGYTNPGNDLQPVAPSPTTVAMSPAEFQARYTVPTLMNDGSWVPTTNSVAEQAFGIPKGTPMSQVDLNNLTPRPGAEGSVMAPVINVASNNKPAEALAAASQVQVANGMGEAAGLLNKINSGKGTQDDVNAFLAKLIEIAKNFADSVGDTATESSSRKAKKGVAAQAEGGVATTGTKALAGSGVGGATKGLGNVVASAVQAVQAATSPIYNPSQGVAPGFSGSTTGKSWLMAIAEAMGNVLGSKVQQMLTSSSKMASLTVDQKGLGAQAEAAAKPVNDYLKNVKDGKETYDAAKFEEIKAKAKPEQDLIDTQMRNSGQEFTVESSKLQGAAQEFSMLQNAFSNAIKSIGEGLGQLARKG